MSDPLPVLRAIHETLRAQRESLRRIAADAFVDLSDPIAQIDLAMSGIALLGIKRPTTHHFAGTDGREARS